MKYLRYVILVITVACVTGCVSPFYGTARIEEGLHVDAGLAGGTYMFGEGPTGSYSEGGAPYYIGLRGDIELRYGFGKYIQGSARTGIGWGFNGKRYEAEPVPVEDNFLLDVALGSQLALPIVIEDLGQITPALRFEGCYGYSQLYLLPTFALGFGNPEYLTLGGRIYYPFPTELFACIHVWRVNVFAGVNTYTTWLHPDYWRVPAVVTFGVGYKIK
ncbi:hypothetical protein GF359_07505 [candidate division WOR-3 bacterium]|uniref:Outer membrane protein beta-barrel domain-containing protein n=1 Tax=candidate division WOR-3 bacterium TaxID=2052148 RepID=A0A9D5KC80_UNCW3|nr:hypothetical protein [candidate division WOR-3 bacterium]MBD3365046.1 hypothetical protein [candidate division WOR-3 bacterium]